MKNVEITIVGQILNIKVDLTAETIPSKSGKTLIIASTEGNVRAIAGSDIKVGLNVYKPRGDKKAVSENDSEV